MARTLEVDDSKLDALFNELGEKERVKALKGAFRAESRAYRKAAIANLRASQTKSGTFNSNAVLEKGVRALVFKRALGFRVTVGTVLRWNKAHSKITTKKGFYQGSRSKYERPVLIWAEEGTKARYTKNARRTKHKTRRGYRWYTPKANKYRGRMPSMAFMWKTRNQMAGIVTNDIHNNVREYVLRTAKKYGCHV